MSIILYGSRLSPFVEKVYRGLTLKGLSFTLQEPTSPTTMRRSNPTTGKMPALDLNGKMLYDSTFILRALDETQPNPPLLSSDPHVAAQQRLLEDWSDEVLYWYAVTLRWKTPENRARSLALVSSLAPPPFRPLVRVLFPRLIAKQTQAQGLGRLPLDVLVRELDIHLEDAARFLGSGPFFFSAPQPSIADLAIFGQLGFLRSPVTPEGTAAVGKQPKLVDFYNRLDAMTSGR